MTIFANNNEFKINQLNDKHNQVVIGEWNQYNSGGSHLATLTNTKKDNWSSNPRFLVTLDTDHSQPVHIKGNSLMIQ